MFGILTALDLIVVDDNITNSLSELDFLVEVPETKNILEDKTLNEDENIFCRFISLFNNTKYHNSLNILELKNTYYINNIKAINDNNNHTE
jgi:hypothetical protein